MKEIDFKMKKILKHRNLFMGNKKLNAKKYIFED
jgi:hypothetical protein